MVSTVGPHKLANAVISRRCQRSNIPIARLFTFTRFNYGKKSPRRYDSIFYDQKISVFLARFISVLGGHETSRCKNELALTIPVALPHMS